MYVREEIVTSVVVVVVRRLFGPEKEGPQAWRSTGKLAGSSSWKAPKAWAVLQLRGYNVDCPQYGPGFLSITRSGGCAQVAKEGGYTELKHSKGWLCPRVSESERQHMQGNSPTMAGVRGAPSGQGCAPASSPSGILPLFSNFF